LGTTGRSAPSRRRPHVRYQTLLIDEASHLAWTALSMIGADGWREVAPGPAFDMLGRRVDACDLFIAAYPFGLAGNAGSAFADHDALRVPTSPFGLYAAVATTAFANQTRAWKAISAAFADADIPSLVIKGLQVQSDGFRALPRLLADIDVLVHEVDGPRAISALRSLGFASPHARDNEWVQGHYEAPVMRFACVVPELEQFSSFIDELGLPDLFKRAKDGSLVQMVAVDLHHNVLLPKISEGEMWRSPYGFTIDGAQAHAPSIALTLWWLAVRCYREATRGEERAGRMIADPVILTRRHGVPEDELLGWVVRRKYSAPALFYVYSFLARFCRVPVSDVFLDDVRRIGLPARRGHDGLAALDRGDLVPYLFGHRAAQAADMWFLYELVVDESLPFWGQDG
jgi:hypothetical protein